MNKHSVSILSLAAIFALCGCGKKESPTDNTYILSFYQEAVNHFDEFTVTIGKTTMEEIRAFAEGLRIYPKEGYDLHWDWDNFDFEHQKDDWCIEALYDLHHYRISFQYEGQEVAYTTYTLESNGVTIPDLDCDEPGYVYYFEGEIDIVDKHEDMVVEVERGLKNYVVTFKASEDDLNPTIVEYTVENPIVVAPEGLPGYDCAWVSDDETYEAGANIDFTNNLGDHSFLLSKTGKQFTVTLLPNGGTVESETVTVTYGDPYDFSEIEGPTSDFDFIGWFDEDGNPIPATGTWDIAKDATLSAKWGFSFESGELGDSFLSDPRLAYSIVDGGTDGTKSLKIAITGGNSNAAIKVAQTVLDAFFMDPKVVAVNFDAKGSIATSNFRYAKDGSSALTYENNSDGWGLDTDWKTFSFKRSFYTQGGQDTLISTYSTTDFAIYLDNIRPVYEGLTSNGFENGRLVPRTETSDKYYAKCSYRDMAKGSPEAFTATDANSYNGVTGAKELQYNFDYAIKSEGNRSMHLHRNPNQTLRLAAPDIYMNQLGDNDLFSIDLYTTVNLNSNPSNAGITRGDGSRLYPDDKTRWEGNKWGTLTFTKAQFSGSTFLAFNGSPEYDVYVDNMKIIKAANA